MLIPWRVPSLKLTCSPLKMGGFSDKNLQTAKGSKSFRGKLLVPRCVGKPIHGGFGLASRHLLSLKGSSMTSLVS